MWANSTETTDTASKKCEMWNAIRSLSTFQSVIQSGLRVPMLLLLSILYGPLHWESHCAELATINLDSTECQLNHWKQISLTIKLETENQLSPNRTWSTGAYPQLTVQYSKKFVRKHLKRRFLWQGDILRLQWSGGAPADIMAGTAQTRPIWMPLWDE